MCACRRGGCQLDQGRDASAIDSVRPAYRYTVPACRIACTNWTRLKGDVHGTTVTAKISWRLSALRMVLADPAGSQRLGAWRVSSAADWNSLDWMCFTTCSSRVVSLRWAPRPGRSLRLALPQKVRRKRLIKCCLLPTIFLPMVSECP